MAKRKCPLCKTRKASRQCSKYDTFICSVCCAENRDEKLCSSCTYFKAAQNYSSGKIAQKKEDSIASVDLELIDVVDDYLELAESGKVTQARIGLEKLNDRYPNEALIHFGIAVTYSFQENHQKAKSYLLKAIEIDPLYAEAHFNLALLYQLELNLYGAIIHFRKVYEVSESIELAEKAEDILTNYEDILIKKDGMDLNSYMKNQETFFLGFTEMEQNNWKKAIEAFQKVLEVKPNHLSSMGNIGLCYGQLTEYSKAITYLDMALEIDHEYEPAISNKAIFSTLLDGEPLPKGKIRVGYYGNTSHKK